MTYSILVYDDCKKEIEKATKKNPVLEKCIRNKINEIVQNPAHYKPLKYDLAGERRVHILKSFVLKFEIDENRKIITLLAFTHHDDAYQK
jgi:YafQ family addiction module toxin component